MFQDAPNEIEKTLPFEPLAVEFETQLIFTIEQFSRLELRPLPSHLKDAYLSENKTSSVIISNNLSPNEEVSLLLILSKKKKQLYGPSLI